ncbi:MAG: CHAT domain-containing protein [Planctomycetes bacterium]|nr:CHAT domain-containing protein [Planctomycetota bacterium]
MEHDRSPPSLREVLQLEPDERRRRLAGAAVTAAQLSEMIRAAERMAIEHLADALEATGLFVEVADERSDPALQAQARRARAHALAYGNRLDEALKLIGATTDFARRSGDARVMGEVKMTELHVLSRLGRSDEALIAGRDALKAFDDAGDTRLAARAEVNLGIAHRTRGDAEAALACFDRARGVLAADPIVTAQIDSNRAEALLDLNRFEEAESVFRDALAAFEQAGLSAAVAIVEGNLADLMSRQGRIEGALYHFEQARRCMSDEAPGDVARLNAEEAETLLVAGMVEDAAESLADALSSLEHHGLAWEAARCRVSLARAYLSLGRGDEAHEVLGSALETLTAREHRAALARARLVGGAMAAARGSIDDARAMLHSALDLLGPRAPDAVAARSELAALAIKAGNLEEAGALLEAALADARRLNLAPMLADLLVLRGNVSLTLQQPGRAIDELREAVEQVERIRGSLQAERFRTAFAGSRTAAYEQLVLALVGADEPDPTAVLTTIEKAKSRSLLDLVSGAIDLVGAPSDDGDDDEASGLLNEIGLRHREMNVLYSRLETAAGSDDGSFDDASWRQQVEACERSVRHAERRLGATRGLGSVFAPALDTGEIQRLLAPESALVEYFVAGDELLAVVVRPDSARVVRGLARSSELADMVERLRFQVDRVMTYPKDAVDDLVADARRELGELHATLLAPLRDDIDGAEHLHVVPHGPLHAVPFHALWDGDRYLVEDVEVTYSPSSSILDHLPTKRTPGPADRQLVYGVADAHAPTIEQEIAVVAAAQRQPIVKSNREATVEHFRAHAGDADLIHLASHGRFDPTRPLASGVKLGDRWLTIRDLYSVRLRDPIVVLSGCDTGAASIDRGDELVGLVRGFFAAGASALVMSLWALHDETTSEFMADLYGGQVPADAGDVAATSAALRRAQLRFMQRRPHPAYWAPFVLVGRRGPLAASGRDPATRSCPGPSGH